MKRDRMMMAFTAILVAVGLATSGCTAAGGEVSLSGDLPTASVGADKATQVTMEIYNGTGEMWNVTSATDSGTWQDRASNLAPLTRQTVSNYSSGSAEITVEYTGAVSGYTYTFTAETPLAGGNSASGSTTNPAYQIVTTVGGGYNPTNHFTTGGGQTFAYTGATQTYTVPVGVTVLHFTATGGGSAGQDPNPQTSYGAQIDGYWLNVTAGDVLTVGVGGAGNNPSGTGVGGWGMTNGTSSYGGGSAPWVDAGGGGGATVVVDQFGVVVLVAGGGGGGGGGQTDTGGNGGYNGSLTGQAGGPSGHGGPAGANTTSQGQSSNNNPNAGGAGGGGFLGGLAGGPGGGYAGGAGSSSLGVLESTTTVQTATSTTGSLTIAVDEVQAAGASATRQPTPVRSS